MDWYIVYKGKAPKGLLEKNLQEAGIPYLIPGMTVEKFKEDHMEYKQVAVLNNLLFIQTDGNIWKLIPQIPGLKAPYKNYATGKPAIISDPELQRFRRVLEAKSIGAEFLQDPFTRFECCPRVRVKDGEFKGLEGRVFRIRHDRKLVIKLENMALAISGIHHSLLEIIEK